MVIMFASLRTIGRSRLNGRNIPLGVTVGSEFSAAPFDDNCSVEPRKLKVDWLILLSSTNWPKMNEIGRQTAEIQRVEDSGSGPRPLFGQPFRHVACCSALSTNCVESYLDDYWTDSVRV
jgi:hypothetical protein